MAYKHTMVNDHRAPLGKLAVHVNGAGLARELKYSDPSECRIAEMQIITTKDEEILLDVKVEEGKYLSAIWVEYQHKMLDNREPLDSILIDDAARDELKAYMGEKISSDAVNPELKNHDFVRTLLSTDEIMYIEITWKN